MLYPLPKVVQEKVESQQQRKLLLESSMDYFIVFGSIGILFLISVSIILRLIYQMSDMKYELKIAKINCQKDLDRIEDRINQLANRDNDTYKREIQKLEKLHKSLSDLIDSKEKEIKSNKQILND